MKECYCVGLDPFYLYCNSLSNALKLLKKATFYYFFEKLISKIKLQFLLKTLLVFNDINLGVYFVIIDVTCIQWQSRDPGLAEIFWYFRG
jgi:hypothetical protein